MYNDDNILSFFKNNNAIHTNSNSIYLTKQYKKKYDDKSIINK